jgi:hypothetical protein
VGETIEVSCLNHHLNPQFRIRFRAVANSYPKPDLLWDNVVAWTRSSSPKRRLTGCPTPGAFFVSLCIGGYRTGGRAALMRINIWIVLVVLMTLLAVTQLLRYHQDAQRICADDPSASVCGR